MPRKASTKPKGNPWAESQFKKAKVTGDPSTWNEAAEALAPPKTDAEKVREMLLGVDSRRCHACKKLMRPHSVILGEWKKVLPELIDKEDALVCGNQNCPEYGKRYAS